MTPDYPNTAARPGSSQPGFLRALLGNLRAGLCIASGLRPSRDVFYATAAQLIALILLFGLVEAAGSWLGTEAPRRFDPYGLNYLGATLLFNLLVLLLACRLAGGGLAVYARLAVGYLSASVTIALVSQLLWQAQAWYGLSADWAWSLFWLLLCWQWLVVVLLLRQQVRAPVVRALFSGAGYALALLASLWIFPRSDLWYSDVPEQAEAAEPALDVESIFYAQPALMDATLDAIAPQRPGIEDLYLMAVGGYGLEDVFLNEVEYVRDLFDRTYGTEGRSLVLSNNPASLGQYPLANVPNLEHALAAVAERMDTDEDVLFLFLTSHGSRDHRFALEMGPLQLKDLTPAQLRAALDRAGIRWRVVLVSSCYSGGFVEPLRDPETLIITAAAADRTSFGCGVDSDFTYFGTAYFKQALPAQPRFIQAFDLAAEWVRKREAVEKLEPSQPQIFVGEAIAAKLASLYAEPSMQAALGRGHRDARACNDSTPPERCN